jgi:hypothetical protein
MTARKLAELASEDALTQSLIGRELKALRVIYGALAVIRKYGNCIPEEVGIGVLTRESGAKKICNA